MALISKLENIADAIREKTGKEDKLTLDEMAVEIAAIETGGGGESGIPEEAFKISGKCDYMFAENKWAWFIDMYGNKITTEGITAASQMFIRSQVNAIPFDINIAKNCSTLAYVFSNCENITEIPLIKGEINAPKGNYNGTVDMGNLFNSCHNIRNIPYDYFNNFGGDAFWEASKKYSGGRNAIFAYCYSLRQLPELSKLETTDTSYFSIVYNNICQNCYALDEITNLPVLSNTTLTSNAFAYSFQSCNRVKNITFAAQADGTPYTAPWKNQTIDLSNTNYPIGYSSVSGSNGNYYCPNICNYNSGITIDKWVHDEATYAALKDDPDWFAGSTNWSRYNHDSAVNTINSLPDTSAYGTNTIKFRGASGTKTDGGAINTLTEEEIAVAAAKGWTVTLV